MINFALSDPSEYFEYVVTAAQLTKTARNHLKNAYMAGDRAYHNAYHIAFFWYCHRELSEELAVEDEMKFINAVACHDFIYNAQSKTNETDSATWWRKHASNEVNIMSIWWSSDAIEASANHFLDRPMDTPDQILMQWFLGLDLLPLAASYDIFDRNQLMIRAEYSHLTNTEWNVGRKAFLTKAQSSLIYRHPKLQGFEAPAKDNIKRALAELG